MWEKEIISLAISFVSLSLSIYVAISNQLKNSRIERKEKFKKVFERYNKRYQEYYEKMRAHYNIKEKNDYLLMIDKPIDFYPMSEVKINLYEENDITLGIVYNKNKFPKKKRIFCLII